jgi:hydrogenase nickel incorporation protein HypA/HybF
MHELSLSTAIVRAVERHAAGRRVSAVQMRIGALRQVVPDSLAFYFEIVSRQTVCEGALLEHELVPALLRCPECGRGWDPAPPSVPTFRCPSCATAGEVIGGDEFEVESIEVEASDPKEDPCIAPR